MIICPSIIPTTMREAIRQLRRFSASHELVELRIDAIKDLNLKKLLSSRRPELIVTNRSQQEGGAFRGRVSEQLALVSQAQAMGAEYVDVDGRCGKKQLRRFLKPRSVILSHHDFKRTPRSLVPLYRKMKSFGTGIIKIAVTASDISDNLRIFHLLKHAKKNRTTMIAHCMGERGEISRILGGKYDAFLSYASIAQDRTSGPGQLTVDLMEKTFHADRIDQATTIFGLIGNPVKQSKGIFYHNAVFQRKKINAVYLNFFVDDIVRFFRSYSSTLQGASVTMPFKESIIPMLDRIDEPCTIISSVNTIVRKAGAWHGTNTDLPALLTLLRRKTELKGKRVLILGTGAMARTMLYAANDAGAIPILSGRSARKLKSLSKRFGCEWTSLDRCRNARAEIIMNATSIGMADQPQSSIVPRAVFKNASLVVDAVNRPVLTPFLSAARRAGCTIITGRELFYEQAKLQSRIFLRDLT